MNEKELIKFLSKERVFLADAEPWETYDPKDLEMFVRKALNYFFEITIVDVKANALTDDKYGHSGTELIILTDKFSFKVSDVLGVLYCLFWDILNQIKECHKITPQMSFCDGLVEIFDMTPSFVYVTKDEFDYLIKNGGISYFPYRAIKVGDSFRILPGVDQGGCLHTRILNVEIIDLRINKKVVLNGIFYNSSTK